MRLAVDLHTHTVASTGGGLTEPDLIAAAVAAGLDVLGITEHDSTDGRSGVPVAPVIGAPIATDRLLVVRGREVTVGPGHRVILDDGPVILAHPFAPYPGGSAADPPARGELLEVWNGPWRSDRRWQANNESALAWWMGLLAAAGPRDLLPVAVGNSDTHLADQIGTPCTVIEVEGRSVAAVLTAVSSGRSWIVVGTHLVVELAVCRNGMTAGPGQALAGRGPLTATVTVTGTSCCLVTLLDRDGVVVAGRLEHDGTLEWEGDPVSLLRVEIRDRAGGMLAMCNPVRLVGLGE